MTASNHNHSSARIHCESTWSQFEKFKMIAKLLMAASVFVATLAVPAADKYPAGLNPNLCPNYPHCDNALLAAHSQRSTPEAYHNPASVYGFPRAYPDYFGFSNPAVSYTPGYPAGVNPASCPNYPYCTTFVPTGHQAAPLPGFSSRQYPDGINPSTCPNYPFCH